MVGLLIEDVTLVRRDEITAHVRFRGGATTTLTLPLPLNAWQGRTTPPHVLAKVDELLADHTDAKVASLLNQRGVRTGADAPFNSNAVKWVRSAHGLKSLRERLKDQGWLPTADYAKLVGVCQSTLKSWLKKGLIQGRICNDAGDWMFEPNQMVPSRSKPGRKPRRKTANLELPTAGTVGGAV